MSLAIALHNYHGIVMLADKMMTSTFEKDGNMETINLPPTDQKLFLIENKYGLSYTGTASINGIPISALLKQYFLDNIIGKSNPISWLLNLANHFHNLLSDNQNIIFIMCGYYNGGKFVINTNTSSPQINFSDTNHPLVYSGESDILTQIININKISYEFPKFTIQDSIDFLYFLNRTVAGMMYFGQYLPTVSKECDILTISPIDSHWVLHNPLNSPRLGI